MNNLIIAIVAAAAISSVLASHHHDEDHGPAHYHFDYLVHDPHTGDKKEQYEDRDGHHLKGSYAFKEADGTVRVVDYIAGPHNGFNAVVKRIGYAHHPQHYGHGHGHGHHGGYDGQNGGAYSRVGTTHYGYHY